MCHGRRTAGPASKAAGRHSPGGRDWQQTEAEAAVVAALATPAADPQTVAEREAVRVASMAQLNVVQDKLT